MQAQLLAQAAGSADYSGLVWLGIIVGGGYLLSLWLHPYRACRVCKGSPRLFGAIYTRAFRRCPHCNMTGRVHRLGTRVFRPGYPD